ncbi:MAG: IS21-like element helper ATPase IstB [Pirellulales bacterium]
MAKKKTTHHRRATNQPTNQPTKKTTKPAKKAIKPTTQVKKTIRPALRDRILAHFEDLGVRLSPDQFDIVLAESEKTACSHLEFLERVLSPAAAERRQRSIQRRIHQARFHDEAAALETFDWKFNSAIDRRQIEELATADFVRRGDNLVLAGQSGLGKSHLIQSIGRRACVAGYRVCYITSAELLRKLGASLADGTTPRKIRHYVRYDLLIIDEFGFDRLEREELPQAASLLYKVIDGRARKCSTALVTNIDFDAWGEYLGDAPLAMALLDRLVDGALILKFRGKSYRAHRAKKPRCVK